jgi:RNA polymerase sigma factor (sigma-70 family)
VTTVELTDFDAERPQLTAIAVRILGSEADADDVLQEAWLRLSRTDAIDDLPAWLTTVVTRLCLDHLRKRRTRSMVESMVPDDHAPIDPEGDALLAEVTGDAMQVVLDALAPAERVAFVLHDVFGYPFDEVSAVMGVIVPTWSGKRWARNPRIRGQPQWLLASTAPGERHRSPSTVSWVPLGSKPDRPRWHSSSISTRRAWCTRSS